MDNTQELLTQGQTSQLGCGISDTKLNEFVRKGIFYMSIQWSRDDKIIVGEYYVRIVSSLARNLNLQWGGGNIVVHRGKSVVSEPQVKCTAIIHRNLSDGRFGDLPQISSGGLDDFTES